MADLIASKMVTARKAHSCMICGHDAIQPGDTYERQTLVNDARLYNWVSCGACADLATEVWRWTYNSDDEGIGREEYIEWAHDHTADPELGEAARSLLARAFAPSTTGQENER